MEEKDKYLFWELFTTFFLLHFVILLFDKVLSGYRLYLTLGLAAGFGFGWLNRNRQNILTTIFVDAGTFGIFIWIVYSLLTSSFFYKDVILIFIKGGLFLEILLAFQGYSPSILSYIQALSLPLFMCFPIFVKSYNVLHAILALFYLACWAIILKLKFYGSLKPIKEKGIGRYYTLFISFVLFLTIIYISWMLFYHISLGKVEKGGMFLQEEDRYQEGGEEMSQSGYYDLQDKVQKKISELISEFDSKEDRHGMLDLLSSLMKDSPSVREIKRAEQGLVDYLRRLGPGLEKETAEAITLTKEYLDKKILLNIKKIKENIVNNVNKRNFNIKEKIAILSRVNNMQYGNSYQKVKEYERELRQVIDKSSVSADAKTELKAMVSQLREWKALDIYRKTTVSLNKEINNLERQSKEEFTDLLSGIDRAEAPSEFKELKEEIKELKGKAPERYAGIIKKIEEILDLKLDMSYSEEEISRMEEEAGSKEELKEINQTGPGQEQKETVEQPYSKEEEKGMIVKHTWLDYIIKVIYFLVLGIITLFIVFYLLTEREKNKLRAVLCKNPRGFIINIYENIKKILALFNLKYQASFPPLAYAELVQKSYPAGDNLFLGFTVKFEEAKYSHHILQLKDAYSALDDYNNFLKALFSRHGKACLCLKYCLALLQKRPFFIPKD